MKNLQKGFSLIELLIVIAIIGILAAIAIPSYKNYQREVYDVWLKRELSEQGRFLKMTHSIDGGYHQWIGLMGYRPAKGAHLGMAGFHSDTKALAPCCAVFGAKVNAVAANDCNFSGFETIKCDKNSSSAKRNAWVNTDLMCEHNISCALNKRGSVKSFSAALSANTVGAVESGCSPPSGLSVGKCNCEDFILAGATSYGKTHSSAPENVNASRGDGLMTLNSAGKLCKTKNPGFSGY